MIAFLFYTVHRGDYRLASFGEFAKCLGYQLNRKFMFRQWYAPLMAALVEEAAEVVFARRDRYPVFHHLRKFPGLEIQKLGWSTISSKNWANNFWEGADKFLMEGAARRKIGEN